MPVGLSIPLGGTVSTGYDQGVLTGSRLSTEASDRLDRLFRLYSGRVLTYAATRARRPQDAEDISGDTWVRAVRSIHQLRCDDTKALKWLYGMVRHSATDYYRPKKSTEQITDFGDAISVRLLPSVAPADADLYALAELTASQARVVKLAAQGLSQGAIAARIGRSSGAVFSHLHRGARKLRAEMAR